METNEEIYNENNLSKWTKKLDEIHYYQPGVQHSTTLCGKPMLGNNYAKYFPDREDCKKCRVLMKQVK